MSFAILVLIIFAFTACFLFYYHFFFSCPIYLPLHHFHSCLLPFKWSTLPFDTTLLIVYYFLLLTSIYYSCTNNFSFSCILSLLASFFFSSHYLSSNLHAVLLVTITQLVAYSSLLLFAGLTILLFIISLRISSSPLPSFFFYSCVL